MFGHRPVGWGRHAGAVFAAAFVSSTTQAAVTLLTTLTAMQITGASLGPSPAIVVGVAMLILWLTLFLIVLAELGLAFTIARAVLMLSKRNFGAAYLAAGLVVATLEAKVIATLKGTTSPNQFLFAAAIGVLGGFVYWLVASRDRDATTREERAKTAELFA